MNFSTIDILLGVCFSTMAVLTFIVLVKSHAKSSKFFALTTFSSSFWILSSFLFYNLENGMLVFWARMQYVSAAFVIMNFLFFVRYFLSDQAQVKRSFGGFFLALFICLTVLILFTNGFIGGVEVGGPDRTMTYGPLYYFYILYFAVIVSLIYFYLLRKYKIAKKRLTRAQLVYVGIGSSLTIAIGVFFDVLMPLLGNFHFLWLGPASATFFVIFTSYAILRYHLFEIKVVTTELLVFAVLITVFLQVLLAGNTKEAYSRGIFFVIILFLGIFLLRSIYQEIRQREAIERLANRLSNFVSFTTHELRSPIGKFKSMLSMLAEGDYGKVDGKVRENLMRCFDIATEMGQNIETFLCLNKLEIDKLLLSKQSVDISEIIFKSVEDFKERAVNKGIAVTFERPSGVVNVFVDKFSVAHIVNNLLSNAIKYTPAGGRVKIYTKKGEGEKALTCVVEDTGVGISKNDLGLLFEEYERGGGDKTKLFEGSGIGLFLAKKLVELHGGKIWAESQGKDKGSKFGFTLPLS